MDMSLALMHVHVSAAKVENFQGCDWINTNVVSEAVGVSCILAHQFMLRLGVLFFFSLDARQLEHSSK